MAGQDHAYEIAEPVLAGGDGAAAPPNQLSHQATSAIVTSAETTGELAVLKNFQPQKLIQLLERDPNLAATALGHVVDRIGDKLSGDQVEPSGKHWLQLHALCFKKESLAAATETKDRDGSAERSEIAVQV